MQFDFLLKIFSSIKDNWVAIVHGGAWVSFAVMSILFYKTSGDLSIEKVNHELTKQTLAIEKKNVEEWQHKVVLQTELKESVDILLRQCYKSRTLENDLNSEREDILSKDVPISDIEQSNSVKVVNHETRVRGFNLINSLIK